MSRPTFRPAVRESVGLLIGIAGGPGSGKTYSALELATGLVAGTGKRIGFIDTEARRALHYADQFDFDHCNLDAPFTPDRYLEAIKTEEAYGVLIIDSLSHEWAGEGGILEMHESELQRMAGDDWQKRERCKFSAWIKPKAGHKRLVYRMLQSKAHLIFCCRAEDKIQLTKGEKITEVKTDWIPVAEKSFLYEMHLALLLGAGDRAGVPTTPKSPFKIPEWASTIIDCKQRISRDHGASLAGWAGGGSKPAPPAAESKKPIAAPEATQAARPTVKTPDVVGIPSQISERMSADGSVPAWSFTIGDKVIWTDDPSKAQRVDRSVKLKSSVRCKVAHKGRALVLVSVEFGEGKS